MSNNFKENVKEKIKEIQQKVYIKEEILERIVGLFLSLKEGKFPSRKPPRGILFYGPPGTGKTSLMRTLAEKLGLSEPIIIRGPEIISQYYGKSEQRLRQIFALAKERAEEENLSIIFIDEIDSLAPRRDLTKGELEPRLVGQLLSLMDGLEIEKCEKCNSHEIEKENNVIRCKKCNVILAKGHIVVIGSTNRPEALDPALRRPGRFDLEIEFDPPDVDERKEILKIILNNYAKDRYEDINFDKIAEQTIGFTGADLVQLVNEALLQAALEGRDRITHEDLLRSKNTIKPSALREFYLVKPKDRSNELSSEIVDKIKQIAHEFTSHPGFKPVLLQKELWEQSDKIASTMAYYVYNKLHCPYIVVRATWFRSRWFGEMERSIRQLFEKIKRLQPCCVVYVKGLDAVANSKDERLRGAVLEIASYLDEFNENNINVLLISSITQKIDIIIEKHFIKFKVD